MALTLNRKRAPRIARRRAEIAANAIKTRVEHRTGRARRGTAFDFLAEARHVRTLSPQTSDSTPILRALREGSYGR
jgi:hypothetical protein